MSQLTDGQRIEFVRAQLREMGRRAQRCYLHSWVPLRQGRIQKCIKCGKEELCASS